MRIGDGGLGNVEDRRGRGIGRMGMPLSFGGVVVLLLLSLIFKQDFFALLGQSGVVSTGQDTTDPQRMAAEEELKKIAVGSFNDAQNVWQQKLQNYRPAKLVLFWDAVQSDCGVAGSEMGPFYCPNDERVYIDLGFYNELSQRFGAPGDFAQAYVIAHEVGHHVQNILGIEQKVRSQMMAHPDQQNSLSVQLELQSDCLAGVWGHYAQQRNLLDPGDIEEGLAAAAAVGDDRLQKAATGEVHPESFTHGSAKQRSAAFQSGFSSGELQSCGVGNPS